jgi:hypothetical protein
MTKKNDSRNARRNATRKGALRRHLAPTDEGLDPEEVGSIAYASSGARELHWNDAR